MGPPRVSLSPQRKEEDSPDLSHQSLPPLAPQLSQRLEQGGVEFPINEECTSLALVPSGRHLVGGFTDGTLRVFDLTGKFYSLDRSQDDNNMEGLFDSDSSSDEDDDEPLKTTTTSGSTTALVCSKSHQRYGTVACQIHAKGVHTSLQMTVDVSPDGLYAFGGVARGSMELVAIDLRKVEQHHDVDCTTGLDLLDLMDVHRHADAKLRGFGACTRLKHKYDIDEDDSYILLTGKGIKNIHIWSFTPAQDKWQCLYDTQSNGNSISMLHLRYSPSGDLHAISKSDRQKLRVWDLSDEQQDGIDEDRPKRPPYKDIRGTESVLGIGGDFGFGGQFQQISLVNLNVDPPYNITEVALPTTGGGRRQQRGELKSLQDVTGMDLDGSHVLLEMTDSSVVHFSFQANSVPKLEPLTNFGEAAEGSRTFSLARIGSEGVTVAAMASVYNGNGSIVLQQIGGASSDGYWGFHGVGTAAKVTMSSPVATDLEAIAQAAGSSVNRFHKSHAYTGGKTLAMTSNASPEIYSTARNVSPSASVMSPAGVPASAIRARDSSVVKARPDVVPASAKKGAMSVSPDSVKPPSSSEAVVIVKKKKKKKRKILSEDGNKENKPEKKKLVLHIRRPKEAEALHEETGKPGQTMRRLSTSSSKDKLQPSSTATSSHLDKWKRVDTESDCTGVSEHRKERSGVATSIKLQSEEADKKTVTTAVDKVQGSVKAYAPEGKQDVTPAPSSKFQRRNSFCEPSPKSVPRVSEKGLEQPATKLVDNADYTVALKSTKKRKCASNDDSTTAKRSENQGKDSTAKPHNPKLRGAETKQIANLVKQTPKKAPLAEKKRKVNSILKTKNVAEVSESPQKKSRIVELNLGNANQARLPPKHRWKLPSQPVSRRFEPLPSSTSNSETKRIKLVLEHRAAHETVRRKVLESVTAVMKTMDRDSSIPLEEARTAAEDAIAVYSEMLDGLIFRQELEASALAATLSLPFTPAVSFPFPEVFDQARKTMSVFIDNRKRGIQQ